MKTLKTDKEKINLVTSGKPRLKSLRLTQFLQFLDKVTKYLPVLLDIADLRVEVPRGRECLHHLGQHGDPLVRVQCGDLQDLLYVHLPLETAITPSVAAKLHVPGNLR